MTVLEKRLHAVSERMFLFEYFLFNSCSLLAFYTEKKFSLSKKFLEPVLLLYIAEIWLTAGEGEFREDVPGAQGQKVAVGVSDTASVDHS